MHTRDSYEEGGKRKSAQLPPSGRTSSRKSNATASDLRLANHAGTARGRVSAWAHAPARCTSPARSSGFVVTRKLSGGAINVPPAAVRASAMPLAAEPLSHNGHFSLV